MPNQQELLRRITELETSVEQLLTKKAEFEQLAELIQDAVFITEFNKNFLFCNQNTYRFFGFEPTPSNKEFLVNEIFDNHPDEWKVQHDSVLAKGESDFEMLIRKSDTDLIKVNVHSRKIIFEGKNCLVSYIRDISDQTKFERSLIIEQQKNKLIIDSIPAMIFIKDKENRFYSANKAFEEQTGYKNEEIFKKSVFDLTHDKVLAEENWKDDLEVIETGIPKRNIIETLFTDKHRWFLTDKIPYRNPEDEIIGIIGFSIDISEHKHAEEELLRSEKMFRLLFETAPDGIILSSLDGKIHSTNKAIENLLGYSSDEFKSLTYFDITPEKWQKIELQIIEEALQNHDNVRSIEKEFIRKDNVIIPVLVTGWIIYNEEGVPFQLGTYVKDLSIEKKAAALENYLLQKENEQLEKDLASKTRELNLQITKLIDINALVDGVIKKLDDILQKDVNEKNKVIAMVMNELASHTNEDLWKQLELTFGQVHQSFYDKLYTLFPDLTRNEKRLCALLKMNLSTKDISSITHQTMRSIEVARARLRTKMKLKRYDSLTKFFSQI